MTRRLQRRHRLAHGARVRRRRREPAVALVVPDAELSLGRVRLGVPAERRQRRVEGVRGGRAPHAHRELKVGDAARERPRARADRNLAVALAEARDGGAFGRQPVDGRLEAADATVRRRVLRASERSVGGADYAAAAARGREGARWLGRAALPQRLLRRGSSVERRPRSAATAARGGDGRAARAARRTRISRRRRCRRRGGAADGDQRGLAARRAARLRVRRLSAQPRSHCPTRASSSCGTFVRTKGIAPAARRL